MKPDFSIRPARQCDQSSLMPLFAELDEHHRHVRPDIFRRPEGARRDANWLSKVIEGPDSIVFVADSGSGDLVGFTLIVEKDRPASIVSRARRFAELDQIVVRGEARRLGIGKALLAQGKDWAERRNLPDWKSASGLSTKRRQPFTAAPGLTRWSSDYR